MLAIISQVDTIRNNATQADVNIVSAPLRQYGSSQNDKQTGLLDRINSIWLRRRLIGWRVAEYLRMGRINKKKTAADIWRFFMEGIQNNDIKFHFFASNY